MRSRKGCARDCDPRKNEPAAVQSEYSNINTETLLLQTIIPLFGKRRPQDRKNVPYADRIDDSMPRYTVFTIDENEAARQLVSQMKQDCPTLMRNRDSFMGCMEAIYHELNS